MDSDRAYPVRDEDGLVIRGGVAEDITTAPPVEDALRESEALRKSAIMESALDAIVTMDAQGRIVESNPAAGKMFGHNRAAGRTRVCRSSGVPALREWFNLGLATGFTGEGGPHLGSLMEMKAVRAGGLAFPVEFNLTRIDVEGPPLFTAFIRDITEQRRNEEQVRLLADAVHRARVNWFQ